MKKSFLSNVIVRCLLWISIAVVGLMSIQRLGLNVFFGSSAPTRIGHFVIPVNGWLLFGLIQIVFGLLYALLRIEHS